MALSSQQQMAGATDVLFEPSVGHFWSLLKPRVMSLVVFTGFAGMYLAPGSLHPLVFTIALFAIAAGAGASGAINQWYDRDIDAVMKRTKTRPIPAGFMAPAEALTLGLVGGGIAYPRRHLSHHSPHSKMTPPLSVSAGHPNSARMYMRHSSAPGFGRFPIHGRRKFSNGCIR